MAPEIGGGACEQISWTDQVDAEASKRGGGKSRSSSSWSILRSKIRRSSTCLEDDGRPLSSLLKLVDLERSQVKANSSSSKVHKWMSKAEVSDS